MTSRLLRLGSSTKGCLEIMLSGHDFEPVFKKICLAVYPNLKRDLFLLERNPREASLFIITSLMKVHYKINPVSEMELRTILAKYSVDDEEKELDTSTEEWNGFMKRIFRYYYSAVNTFG